MSADRTAASRSADGLGRVEVAGEGHSLFGVAVPDEEPGVGEGRAIGRAQAAPYGPGPDDQDRAAVGPRQMTCGQQAVARRFPLGDEAEIDDRLEAAILVRKDRDRPADHRLALRGIAGKHRRGLHRHAQPVDPGRPAEQRVGIAVKESVPDLGLRETVPSGKRVGQPDPVEPRFALGEPDDRDAHGVCPASRPSATSRSAHPSGPSKRCVCQPLDAAIRMLSCRSSANSKCPGATPQSSSTIS